MFSADRWGAAQHRADRSIAPGHRRLHHSPSCARTVAEHSGNPDDRLQLSGHHRTCLRRGCTRLPREAVLELRAARGRSGRPSMTGTRRGKLMHMWNRLFGSLLTLLAVVLAPLHLGAQGAKYDRAYLTRWLKDPAAQKPTAHMPKIALTGTEAQALAAYLASLR